MASLPTPGSKRSWASTGSQSESSDGSSSDSDTDAIDKPLGFVHSSSGGVSRTGGEDSSVKLSGSSSLAPGRGEAVPIAWGRAGSGGGNLPRIGIESFSSTKNFRRPTARIGWRAKTRPSSSRCPNHWQTLVWILKIRTSPRLTYGICWMLASRTQHQLREPGCLSFSTGSISLHR